MSKIRDLEGYIEEARKHLAPGYDLHVSEAYALVEMSAGNLDLVVNAFLVGYEKGRRAAQKGF